MKQIEKSAIVPFSAQQMFELVTDISSYPDFLPWCSHAAVLSRENDTVNAEIMIDVKGIKKSFSTINTYTPFEQIDMQLLEGPFSSLSGQWHFQPLNDKACKVSLNIAFSFSNRILSLTLGPVFGHISDSMVDAFCQRAHQVYQHAN
jgi:ribosome-associated toxin RatA of RatAB toxin-antitoxin module